MEWSGTVLVACTDIRSLDVQQEKCKMDDGEVEGEGGGGRVRKRELIRCM